MLHKSTKSVIFLHFLPPCQCTCSNIQPTLWFLWVGIVCWMWNHKCNHIFSHPHIWNKNPSNPNFYRSKHVELTRHEVQTVRRMFQDLKFHILDRPFKRLASCMQIGLLCCKITDCDNRPLRFVRIASFSLSVKRAQSHSQVSFAFRL
jgi:hypothetical protein